MDWLVIAKVLYPETILLVGILVTLFMSLFKASQKHVAGVSVVFLALSSVALLKDFLPSSPQTILFNSFVYDPLSVFFRFMIYFVTLLIVLGSYQYLSELESPSEYYPIMLTAALGGALLTGANDMLLLLVALETLGLSAILLASYARLNRKSNESGIKYLISSAVATGILLLGMSFSYGLTSATNFQEIAFRLFQLDTVGAISQSVIIMIVACFVSAITFKLGAAPFHNWSPDVYTGAPTTTTLFLSVVSKMAGFGLALRLFSTVFNSDVSSYLFAIVAMLSIIIGNYVGLIQMISRSSLKRLLAYSSIAQAGYMCMGLAVLQKDSLAALVIYLVIYALMNSGAFLCAIYIEKQINSDSIYDYAGAITKRPFITVLFALCLINLAGLPFIPAGFIAKFFLFSSAYASGLVFGPVMAIIGLVGSLIALYYYTYLIKIMVVDAPSNAIKALPEKACCFDLTKISASIAVLAMAVVGIFGMSCLSDIAGKVILGLQL